MAIATLFGLNFIFSKNNINSKDSIIAPNLSIIIIISLAYFFFKIQYIAETVHAIANRTYLELALERVVSRYEGNSENLGYSYFLGTTVFFLYGSLYGVILSSSIKSIKWASSIIFLLMIIIETSSFAKVGVLLSLINLLFSLIYNNRLSISRTSFSKIIKYFSLIITISLTIFLISTIGRLNENELTVETLDNKFSIYFFAMYESFGIWYSGYKLEMLGLGYDTFAGFTKFFGRVVPQGYYDFTSTKFGDTNIYTIYRQLINDFSYLAIFFSFFMGISISILDKKNVSITYFILGIISFKILITFIISPYIFSSFLLSDCLFICYVFFNKKPA
jgi:oligosaccharide repeat unit polymerase